MSSQQKAGTNLNYFFLGAILPSCPAGVRISPAFVSEVLEITFTETHIRGHFKRDNDRTCLFFILREAG
jgi:hypothetical protein